MKTYQITDGDTLVVSVDNAAWQTITFKARDFQDIQAATAEELARVLDQFDDLTAYVDKDGSLVLATASRGGHATLEIDLAHSTAAATLGLVSGHAHARGEGLESARLVSRAAAPFPLPSGAEMVIIADGRRRRVTFEKGITAGKATAAEVVAVIHARLKGIARVSRDNRVMLTSTSVGVNSKLEIEGGQRDQGKVDAAAILGFTGMSAFSQPHKAEPARLVCSSEHVGLRVVNLTASPIELHLPAGTVILPARGSLPLPPAAATHGQLQHLIERGVVRLIPATQS